MKEDSDEDGSGSGSGEDSGGGASLGSAAMPPLIPRGSGAKEAQANDMASEKEKEYAELLVESGSSKSEAAKEKHTEQLSTISADWLRALPC